MKYLKDNPGTQNRSFVRESTKMIFSNIWKLSSNFLNYWFDWSLVFLNDLYSVRSWKRALGVEAEYAKQRTFLQTLLSNLLNNFWNLTEIYLSFYCIWFKSQVKYLENWNQFGKYSWQEGKFKAQKRQKGKKIHITNLQMTSKALLWKFPKICNVNFKRL